jgi:hypothetical protein
VAVTFYAAKKMSFFLKATGAIMTKISSTAYVMTSVEKPDICRVGHHSSTNAKREKQVYGGQKIHWGVAKHFCYDSKLTAAAVEALAHALLQADAVQYETNTDQTPWGFRCSKEVAEAALEKAHQVVTDTLLSSLQRCARQLP